MANLLYKGYKTGCYVGWLDGDYEVGVYCYGYGTHLASYYADLEPNTSYTIQRIDTSTRFRIALSQYDLKILNSDSGATFDGFTWGYRADSSDPITFTTGDGNTHLVVYYTNNSEYTTRVMLNEGNSIEPYEEPTVDLPTATWNLNTNNELVHGMLPEPIDYLTPPYPASMWYLDEDNKLMNALLPDEPGGAFTGCTSLAYISIPESVQYIGDKAFRGTALTRVRISRTCEFSETSFPEGCVISYYGDEEEATDVQAQLAALAARVTALENNS